MFISRRNSFTPERYMDLFSWLDEYQRRMFDDLQRFFGSTGIDIVEPRIEIKEDKENYIVKVFLPGVKKDDLEITIDDDKIVVQGEVKETKEKEDENVFYSEMRYGKFQRVVALPGEVVPDKAEAKFEDGVIIIKAPKKQVKSGGVRIKF